MQQFLNGAQAHMACPTVICRYLFIAWINLLQKPPRSDLIRNGSDRGRLGQGRPTIASAEAGSHEPQLVPALAWPGRRWVSVASKKEGVRTVGR